MKNTYVCPKCFNIANPLWTASDHEQHHKSFHPARPLTFPPLPPVSEAAREVGPAVYTPTPYRPTSEDVLWYEASQITIKAEVTIGQFRELAQANGWTEDFLVEQCRGEMDKPEVIVKEILAGKGLTKPAFAGSGEEPHDVNLSDTVLVWRPLLRLYHTAQAQKPGHRMCPCGCRQPLLGRQTYTSHACRQRRYRQRVTFVPRNANPSRARCGSKCHVLETPVRSYGRDSSSDDLRPEFSDMPSPTLLARASRDCQEANRRHREKYANAAIQYAWWPDGAPEDVLRELKAVAGV